MGHEWVGMDISSHMLALANDTISDNDDLQKEPANNDRTDFEEDEGKESEKEMDTDAEMTSHQQNRSENEIENDTDIDNMGQEEGCTGDLIFGDIGQGLPFRAGTLDGAISISCLQWLTQSDHKSHIPSKRLLSLFTMLYRCLKKGARAVFQFYPEHHQQITLINRQALKAGFLGGVVVDYPSSTKAKKLYLVLDAGPSNIKQTQTSIKTSTLFDNDAVNVNARQRLKKPSKGSNQGQKDKEWILRKKAARVRKGLAVKANSAYTGRKRVRF